MYIFTGWIVDITGNYTKAYIFLSTSQFLAVFFLVVLFFVHKQKREHVLKLSDIAFS